ncbi:MAG: hypothetical protein Kow0098_10970 [Ignavibacteriaceae bacterium]
MKRLFTLFFFSLSFVLFAQSKLEVNFDYARFFYDDNSGYIELYYAFHQPSMTITSDTSGMYVNGILEIFIADSLTGEILVDKKYQFLSPVDTLNESGSDKSLIGVVKFPLIAGKYNCSVSAVDGFDTLNTQSVQFTIDMNVNNSSIYYTSDIELANSITQFSEKSESPFYKNTYEVVPNPSGIYGQNYPVIFYYSELYNLNKSVGDEKLKLNYLLLNSRGETVIRKNKLISREHPSIVDVGTINVSKLPSGSYILSQILYDSLKNTSYLTTKKLFIYNPGIIDSTVIAGENTGLLASGFISLSEEELDELYAQSEYIATDKERKQWKRLNEEEAKRKFLYEFWRVRNDNPQYQNKPFMDEYLERVKYANENFGSFQRKGWKTDRGRVYLIYGEPSEIQRFPNEADKKPYEIWEYHQIEGGVFFIFADLQGFNDYQLIHSTKRGEMRDDNWQERIFVN